MKCQRTTAHKSQGSTFHYAIVDLNDLYSMVRKAGADEYHRAFYVAVTRASERVWIDI
ncbi:ATP-binding domain-containing protein [Acidithiobacillus ferrivorans]|uniref:ATP-binding domain-containing protein n=1 Tax=Acidithiobacillus ferrivorans TaxID=160808 RepID=A0A7T4WH44_9PROT|nr:ATP-binding domain-containing protein [Acidithiobacillus ferrivorans]